MRLRPIVVVLPILFAGCAQQPEREAASVDEAAIEAVHAETAAATALAEEGIAQLAAGDQVGATATLNGARVRLAEAAGRCVALAGCEVERVIAAQNALIERQTLALTQAANGEVTDPERDTPLEEIGEEEDSPVMRTVPEASRAVALLKGQDLRRMIQVNEPMKAALEEWLTWMRPNLLDAWEHYQYMRYLMWPQYEKAGLPEALLFGILAKESGGRVHAVSRAGASGPLQFMYYTGVRYGLGRKDGFDTRFDPAEATRANVAYLDDHLRIFNNSLELALGAYNGGEGRMARLSQRGAKSFWDPNVFYRLPAETRDYVPMVLAAAWLFLHPEEYNLVFPEIDARPGEVVLALSQSLNELAVCLGQHGNPRGWFRTLRNLNPRYDSNVKLAPGTRLALPQIATEAFAANCRDGALATLGAELHSARVPPPPRGVSVSSTSGTAQTHVVRRGETLGSIARRFRCASVRTLATANRLKPPYPIRAGQRLLVPACSA
jgi:membrane-bound lytic murein transglycosylase D